MILDRTVQSVGPEQWIRARAHISFTYTHQTLGVSAHGPGTEYVDLRQKTTNVLALTVLGWTEAGSATIIAPKIVSSTPVRIAR